jgi:hypothetical protein
MKKLLTVVVILLVVVAGVVLGVMQPWKQGEDNQNPKTELENGELASAKGTKNDGDTPKTTASNNFPNERKKPRMMQSPTRASLSNPSKGGPSKGGPSKGGPSKGGLSKGGPSKGGPDKGGPDKGGPDKGGPEQKAAEHPNSEALIGSWMTSHNGFEFTIILKKGGKGEMHIAEGDLKATPHMIAWKADAKKLTLVNKDSKTQNEDVTEGQYKLSDENGIKSLQLKYELEKQDFTFISVKY